MQRPIQDTIIELQSGCVINKKATEPYRHY